MKIKRTSLYSNKLFKLHAIRASSVKNDLSEDLEFHFKKALSIIYKYHVHRREIVFIGLPKYTDSNFEYLLQHFSHVIVPDCLWIQGLITNKYFILKSLLKNKQKSSLFHIFRSFTQKKDLVVILDSLANPFALEENHNVRVPLISFCQPPISSDIKSTYKVPAYFNQSKINNPNSFFLSLIISILKKADSLKKFKKFNGLKYKSGRN